MDASSDNSCPGPVRNLCDPLPFGVQEVPSNLLHYLLAGPRSSFFQNLKQPPSHEAIHFEMPDFVI